MHSCTRHYALSLTSTPHSKPLLSSVFRLQSFNSICWCGYPFSFHYYQSKTSFRFWKSFESMSYLIRNNGPRERIRRGSECKQIDYQSYAICGLKATDFGLHASDCTCTPALCTIAYFNSTQQATSVITIPPSVLCLSFFSTEGAMHNKIGRRPIIPKCKWIELCRSNTN
jgi:hypothetical protein